MALKSTPTWLIGPEIAPAARIGTVLSGTYRLDTFLGQGMTGVSYNAWHLRQKQPFAVKLLHRDLAPTHERVIRLRQDLRVLTSLGRHGFPRVELSFAPDGAPFLAVELLVGETLRQCLSHGPLPSLAAGIAVAAMARALEHAHQLGVVHGDLRPENVFLPSEPAREIVKGQPVLLDAALHHLRRRPIGLDESLPLSKLAYLAPEQASGEVTAADRAGDVFALGAILYECLTGQPAFYASEMEVVLEKLAQPPQHLVLQREVGAPPGLAEGLDVVIAGACARDPEARIPTMAEFLTALSQAYAGVGLPLPPPGEGVPMPVGRQRRSTLAVKKVVPLRRESPPVPLAPNGDSGVEILEEDQAPASPPPIPGLATSPPATPPPVPAAASGPAQGAPPLAAPLPEAQAPAPPFGLSTGEGKAPPGPDGVSTGTGTGEGPAPRDKAPTPPLLPSRRQEKTPITRPVRPTVRARDLSKLLADVQAGKIRPADAAALAGAGEEVEEPAPEAPPLTEADRIAEAGRAAVLARAEAARIARSAGAAGPDEQAQREAQAKLTQRDAKQRVLEAARQEVLSRMRAELDEKEARVRAERAEREKERGEQQQREAGRAEAARRELSRLEAERAEAAGREAEQAELARREAERAEAARKQAEQAELARQQAERAEAVRREAERREAERAEAARKQAEQAELTRAEAERVEAQRLADARAEGERAEAARKAAEERDQQRKVAAEAAQAARRVAEQARIAAGASRGTRVKEPEPADAPKEELAWLDAAAGVIEAMSETEAVRAEEQARAAQAEAERIAAEAISAEAEAQAAQDRAREAERAARLARAEEERHAREAARAQEVAKAAEEARHRESVKLKAAEAAAEAARARGEAQIQEAAQRQKAARDAEAARAREAARVTRVTQALAVVRQSFEAELKEEGAEGSPAPATPPPGPAEGREVATVLLPQITARPAQLLEVVDLSRVPPPQPSPAVPSGPPRPPTEEGPSQGPGGPAEPAPLLPAEAAPVLPVGLSMPPVLLPLGGPEVRPPAPGMSTRKLIGIVVVTAMVAASLGGVVVKLLDRGPAGPRPAPAPDLAPARAVLAPAAPGPDLYAPPPDMASSAIADEAAGGPALKAASGPDLSSPPPDATPPQPAIQAVDAGAGSGQVRRPRPGDAGIPPLRTAADQPREVPRPVRVRPPQNPAPDKLPPVLNGELRNPF